MLTTHNTNTRTQMEFLSIDSLIPENHLLRKIDKAISFDFIYEEVKDLYSDKGRPSVDPVVLIKILLIKNLYGIRSVRQTISEIEVNLAYRWFLGYTMQEKIPHFSTLGKNYVRRFEGTGLFEKIFIEILEEADKHNFINAKNVFIDSTHMKASANKNKHEKVSVLEQVKVFQEELEKEINEDRIAHGKEPLKKTPMSLN